MSIDKKFVNLFLNVTSRAALASYYLVGKKDKILVLKNAYINTSKILIANRKDPKYIFVRGFLL